MNDYYYLHIYIYNNGVKQRLIKTLFGDANYMRKKKKKKSRIFDQHHQVVCALLN